MKIEEIARLCHEAVRAICLATGDTSVPTWDESPIWQQDACVKGVRHKLDNPGTTPEQLHENWCKNKREDGWILGEQKSSAAKTHPCLVPYEQLSEIQRLKDHVFSATVVACSAMDAPEPPADVAAQVVKCFTYHPTKSDQLPRYRAIRDKGAEFATLVGASVPKSRELSIALTKIEEAVMWSNAGIARNE